MHPMPRLAALLLPLLATNALADETVTFDDGPLGWSISGRTDVVVDGGNPGANMHCFVDDVFGIEVRTTTDQAFLGDLTRYGRFTLSIDVKINSILIGGGGQQVPRRFAVDLRDYNTAGPYPWTSVWYELGIITTARPGWVRYAVTIDDPNATALPAGLVRVGLGGCHRHAPVATRPHVRQRAPKRRSDRLQHAAPRVLLPIHELRHPGGQHPRRGSAGGRMSRLHRRSQR